MPSSPRSIRSPWLDAIERLANDPALRARLGASGRQRAVEKFGFRPHVVAFEQVYLAA